MFWPGAKGYRFPHWIPTIASVSRGRAKTGSAIMLPDELTQERIARNDARFREANESIEAIAEALPADVRDIPFLCECADMSCTEILRVSIEEYEEIRSDSRLFLNAPGHHVAANGAAKVVEEREEYEVVRKIGHAGEVVERLDERQADEHVSEATAENALGQRPGSLKLRIRAFRRIP